MRLRLAAVILLCATLVHSAEIRGKVVSVFGEEPLGRVQVSVLERRLEAVTANDGSFVIQGLSSGDYTLRLNAVGYRLVTVPFSLSAGESAKEFEITLVPDNFARTEKIEVRGDIFQGPDSPAVNEINLTSTEIRETSTVLADDPFRAIQTLPGVSASGNNDFFAQFSVMGASYANTSTYIDGILVPSPFHGTNITEGATLSIQTSETIHDIRLFPAAYPEKYGDAVGAALDLTTRDGSRTPASFRVSIGLADSELLGEGELGHEKRGSWLASVRKSYLGYLLRNRLHDTYDDISFYDGDLKLTYDLTPSHTVSFYGVGGHTLADLVHPTYILTPGSFKKGTNDFEMGRVGWRWSVSPHFLLDTRAAYVNAPVTTRNLLNQVLDDSHHSEVEGAGGLVWSWRKDHVLEGGWMARRVHESDEQIFYDNNDQVTSILSARNTGWREDIYLQQTSSLFDNRIHLTGGLRLDNVELFTIHPVSPQASVAFQVSRTTQLQFGAGRYNEFEFPAFAIRGGACTVALDFFQTANHYTAAAEQRLRDSSRLRLAVFDRENGSSSGEYADGCQHARPVRFSSRGRDYARGAQIVLQSRTANRLSGWIGYTLTYARSNFIYHDKNGNRIVTPYRPTLEDQRHTVNVFASYRFTPTIHLSGKWLYGSGFPYPGSPSGAPLGDYQRLDVRAEKDWAFDRWKLALYGEVLNLTNHNNPRYFSASMDQSGNVSYTPVQGLPITPTAGIAFEF
jgi:hypothetical protein